MIWKPVFGLLNFFRKSPGLTRVAAAVSDTTRAPSMLDELTAALVPKIAEELRHKPDALDKGAHAAIATADMLLAAHIAGLRTALEAQRREALHLRHVVTTSELGIRLRSQLAAHRGPN